MLKRIVVVVVALVYKKELSMRGWMLIVGYIEEYLEAGKARLAGSLT